MIEVSFSERDLKRIAETFKQLSLKQKASAVYKGLLQSTMATEKALKENISNKILKVRSGRLRSSIGSRVIKTDKGIEGVVGSGVRQGNRVVYANIHETGGTITPKKGKYLTIPLKDALTPAGVPRGRARDFDNTFFMRSKAGNLLLMQRRETSIIPLFVLKTMVRIPARRYMSITLEQMMPKIQEIMKRNIEEALSGKAS